MQPLPLAGVERLDQIGAVVAQQLRVQRVAALELGVADEFVGRPSYKFIGYTQLKRGYTLNPELLGDDRPDLVEAFYASERKWLQTGK